MTLLSKLAVSKKIENLTCREILHPNYTCWQSFWIDSIYYLPSNMKLYFPLIMISLLLRFKKLNYNLIKQSLYQFLDYTISTYIIGMGLTASVCILRNILKRFYFYTIFYIPGILGALPIFFYSSRTSRLMAISIIETCLEIIFRRKSDPISRLISNSKFIQTLIFMICNSIILHLAQKNKIQILWFMKSPKINCKSFNENDYIDEKLNCQHNENCQKYLLNGIKTYTTIGICLDTIKFITSNILPNLSRKKFHNIFMFKTIEFNSTKFMTTYVFLYRATNCFLNKYYTNNSNISNHILASFISGLSYIFNPNLTFLSYAICISIEIMWKSFKLKKSESKIVKILKKICWERIAIPFGVGMIAHYFVYEHNHVSKLGQNFINRSTNFKPERVQQRIQKILSLLTTG